MTRILEPLAPYREHMTIVTGLRNKPAESPEPHAYIERTWLSCVSPKEAGVIGPDAGVTADQLAARHIGQETRVPSLELTTSLRGAQLAWRTPTQSLPQEVNPRNVFYRLFGQGDNEAERAAIVKETGSILDRVMAQAAGLQASSAVRTARPSACTSTPCARSSAACRWRRKPDTSTSTSPRRRSACRTISTRISR